MLSAKPYSFSPHWRSANRNNVFEDPFENDTKKTCDMLLVFLLSSEQCNSFFNRHIFSWCFWWPHLLNIFFSNYFSNDNLSEWKIYIQIYSNFFQPSYCMKLTLSLKKTAWVEMNSYFSRQINVKNFNSLSRTGISILINTRSQIFQRRLFFLSF